jgi:hypothetical protein
MLSVKVDPLNLQHDSQQLEDIAHRLARVYRPEDWVGGVRRAFGAVTLVPSRNSAELEAQPPHFLAALWKPVDATAPFLSRLPTHAMIITPDAVTAVRGLLAEVPLNARLWLANTNIDWSLVAHIVMLAEKRLESYQYRELGAFAKGEERVLMASISVSYEGGDSVFCQFVRTSTGGLD